MKLQTRNRLFSATVVKMLFIALVCAFPMLAAAQTITFSSTNPAVPAANLAPGSTKQPIYKAMFTLSGFGGAGANLSQVTFTVNGTVSFSDFSNCQVWWSSNDNLANASTGHNAAAISGNVVTIYPWNPYFGDNNTYYLWITVDVSSNATLGRTLSVAALTPNSFTFNNGSKTGTMYVGGTQTLKIVKYFRSNASGNWNSLGTWQQSTDNGTTWITATTLPTSADESITVRGTHNVTVTSDVAVDQLTVDAGGQVTVNSGQTLTIANGAGTDMQVNGKLVNSGTVTPNGTLAFGNGSTYQHSRNGGDIPTASWDAASTCLVTGVTGTIPTATSFNQAFGNFRWNCTGQSGTIDFNGNLRNVQGNFTLTTTNGQELRLASGETRTLNIAGNFEVTGGILNINSTNTSSTFTVAVAGDFTHTGGTITESKSSLAAIVFNGGKTQTYTSGGTISNTINFTVNSGTLLQMAAESTKITGTGSFTLAAGATLGVTSANGITTSGATGNIQVTGTRTYNTGASYIYNGTVAQVTGSGFSANTPANLTINNSAGVTLSGPGSISGVLTLTNGVLTTTTTNLLTLNATSASAIAGGSATAYINGPVKWTLPASLTSGSTYVFPVGKSGSYKPFSLVNPTTGTGATTVQVEAFATGSGGSVDATLESISTEDYWLLTKTGNLTNTSVSLGRTTAIAPMNSIASATSVSGPYTARNGTVSTNEITNSNTITIGANTSWYFVLGRISPKITVSTTNLTGFTYAENNGPSTVQSFTVSGTNMTENIRLSLPADSKYELSTESGGLFLGSVNALLINNGSGNVPTTTIYVRLKAGISVGSYSDIITASSTGATSRTINVSGTVTNQPQIIVTPGALTGMSYVLGYGPSATQTFNVKGTSIVGNVTVTAPADFEISKTSATTGFTSTSFTFTKAEVEETSGKTVWVRLKSGLSTSTYNQNITLTATYAANVTVNCQGTVNRATINVSQFTLAGFIYTLNGGPSEIQTFNVSGYALSANIVIAAPTHFAISTSLGGTYGSSITLTQTGGVVNSTPIYVRMKSGYSVGVIPAENILLSSTNAITQSVACSGEVVSGAASISSNPNLNGFFYIVGQGPSIVQSFTVSGVGLTAGITVTAPTDFEISSSGAEGSFVNNFTIAPNGGKINASRVYIRLKAGKTVNTYNGNVTLTSTGTTPVTVACVGKVVPVPTITAGPANPYNVCAGSNVTLTSTGSNIINQSWSGPNGFYSTSPNPNLGTGTTALNGNYTVTGAVGSGVNLLTNGDFELGNTGFGSTYAYNTGTYGRYVITNNPSSVDATYFINGTDHTPSPGTQMMVVDGAETTGAIIWSQTIAVNPNTAYQFSYYAENINKVGNANYAKLQLYVNNVPVGPINTLSATTWSQYLCNVNSGTSTSLQLTLINTFIGGDGNDFGLDDMVFEQVFQVSSTVPLTVNPLVTPTAVIAASSNPSTQGATVTFTATPTNGGAAPTYAWYVNNVLQVGIGATFSYVPQTGDQVKCVLTSSLQCTTANPVNSNTITMVVNPSTNYWRGTNSTDWGTASNWTGNFVPIPGADVVFATVQNFGSAAVNDLVLDQNRTQGSLINQTTKRLVIPPGKALTINNNITTDGNASRIHIQASSTNPNGSLIFYGNSAVYATVEMYSKSSWDVTKTNPKQRYNWQYFGIPVDTITANPTFYGAYVRERNEAGNDTLTHWQSLTNESKVVPFRGYELCYESPRLIAFKGKLVNRNFNSGPLSKTTSGGVLYAGQYIFANPYTAAIDILQLGLGSDMEQKIYLYNTGTFEQWNAVKVSGQIGNAPGQYTAVPKGLAGTNLIPRQLPSMGSMLVRVADPTPNAYVSINYNSVAMGNTDMQRVPSEQMRYNGMSTRFDIEGKTSTDRMWLVPDEKFTRSYDDGYDGEKIPGSALDPQIYAIEEDGNYQVGAIDDLNNTTLAFQAGQDTEYKLTVVHENAEGKYSKIYLVDIVANVVADITESGTEYLFVATSTAKPINRFKVITDYSVDGGEKTSGIKVFTMNNNLCVYNNTELEARVSVFDLAGRNCGYKTVSANGITTFPVRLQQAYIVKAVTDVLSETTKIIIK